MAASGKVRNKGVGATLKIDVKSAINSLKELAKALQETSKQLDGIQSKKIKLEIDTSSFQALQKTAVESIQKIDKAFADGSKKIQSSLAQNLVTTPTSPDFLNKLRDNMRQAQQITADSTAKIQASLNSAFAINKDISKGYITPLNSSNLDALLNNIGKQSLNLSESIKGSIGSKSLQELLDTGLVDTLSAKQQKVLLKGEETLKMLQSSIAAVDTARIAQVGVALEKLGAAFDTIDTGRAAQVGSAFMTLDGLDTAKLVQTSEAIKQVGQIGDELELAEWVRNINAIGKADGFIQMADKAEEARSKVVMLGSAIQNIGNGFSRIGGAISTVGNAIQSYSTAMFRGFMSLQYSLRGVLSAIADGTGDFVSDSIDQIKNFERAQIGFTNFFASKEAEFDAEMFLDRIKQEAVTAQGVNAGDLASYVSQVAPVAANSDQALDVTLGLLKAITYSGGEPATEMNNVIKNIRDVLAKGQAYVMDINQFNRAIPGLTDLLSEMGLDQFIENGQLNITKDNVNQVMTAFAKFNQPGSPVYDILNQMTETLGGLQEMTRETIVQSISTSMQESGLLDIWKDILKNERIQSGIQRGIDTVIRTGATLLSSINIEEIIDSIIDTVVELGNYIRDTLSPALRGLLGLDEGVSMTNVVKKVVGLIGEFGKGLVEGVRFLVEGAKWIKDSILPWLKSLGERLGIDGESLAQWAGFLVTAAPLLSPLVKVIGLATSAFGKLVNAIGSFLVRQGVSDASGTLTSNGGLVNLLGGTSLGAILKKLTSSNVLQGVGLIAGGHTLSKVVGAIFGGTETALGNITETGTALASTFMGLVKITNPVVAGIGTAIEALARLSAAQNAYAEELEKQKYDAMEQSLSSLQSFYKKSALESLRAQGMYAEGDETSQQAEQALLDFIDQYDMNSTADPEQVVKDFIQAYLDTYATWKAGDNLLDTVEEMLDYTSNKFVEGATKLDKSNVGAYADKINAIYDRLLQLGFLSPYSSDMSNVNTVDLWKYLYKQSQNFGSVEFLDAFYSHLNDPDWIAENIASAEVPIMWKVEGTNELTDDIAKALEAAGFNKVTLEDGRVAWQDEGSFKIFVDAEPALEQAQKAKEAMEDIFAPATWKDITNPTLFDPDHKYALPSAAGAGNPTTLGELYDKYSEAQEEQKSWWELLKEWLFPSSGKAVGGYIRPLYRASGGMAQGTDTVPAMLTPGEYVQRSSSVSLAGLSVMEALNHGDLSSAYRLLGAKLNNNLTNQTYGNIHNSDSHNSTTNYVTQIFRNQSGGISGIHSVKRMMAHR